MEPAMAMGDLLARHLTEQNKKLNRQISDLWIYQNLFHKSLKVTQPYPHSSNPLGPPCPAQSLNRSHPPPEPPSPHPK